MTFEFATAGRIVFGPGSLAGIGPLVRDFGRHALVVTGGNSSRAQPLRELLRAAGIAVTTFGIGGEPSLDDIEKGSAHARAAGCEFVVGFGGGSALDAAKAIAALMTNGGELLDYLEVIGRGRPLVHAPAPCIAIPTTAGTGSEVTRNAVLASPAHRVKVSLRSPHLYPRLAIVDPNLTRDLPAALTATTGLDALTQLIEPYVCNRAGPLTDALCIDGIRRAARSLATAVEDGKNAAAREDMALASLFGGLALANAGLGAVHGFAAPIGGRFDAPHGAVCAALLPHVMAANIKALRTRAPRHDALRRYDEIARLVTGRSDARADDGVRWVCDLVIRLQIPPLATYAIGSGEVPTIVEAALKASSMKANPLPLGVDELGGVLLRAMSGESA